MRSRVLAAVVALALAGAGSASATFPGRDGRIALVVSIRCDEYAAETDPCFEQLSSAVVTVAAGGGDARSIMHCPGLACPGGVHQRLAYSPDGTRLAVERYVPLDYTAPPASKVDLLASDGSSASSLTVAGAFVSPRAGCPAGAASRCSSPATSIHLSHEPRNLLLTAIAVNRRARPPASQRTTAHGFQLAPP